MNRASIWMFSSEIGRGCTVLLLCLVFSDLHWVAGGILPYISIPIFSTYSSSATTTLLDGRVAGLFVQRRRLNGLRKGLGDGIVGVLFGFGIWARVMSAAQRAADEKIKCRLDDQTRWD